MEMEAPRNGKIQFDSRITLGNVIEIVTLISVIIMSYYNLKGSQEVIKNQVDRQVADIIEIKQQYLRSDLQATRQEVIVAELKRLSERIDGLQKSLK